jgi:hypothetical protein
MSRSRCRDDARWRRSWLAIAAVLIVAVVLGRLVLLDIGIVVDLVEQREQPLDFGLGFAPNLRERHGHSLSTMPRIAATRRCGNSWPSLLSSPPHSLHSERNIA